MAQYPRYLTPKSERFDPLWLAEETAKIVCSGNMRKYTDFYAVGVYRGIATAYTVGCNLRCYFCWVSPSRDFPEQYGEFYSAREVAEKLIAIAKKAGVKKARISGGEPTICREHLLGVLRILAEEKFPLFILETNGILFGKFPEYAKQAADFENVYIRVSIKAGTAEKFEEKTGAIARSFELQLRAVQALHDIGANFHVALMADPRIMNKDELRAVVHRILEIDDWLARNIEYEVIDPYRMTLFRLDKAGVRLNWK